MTTDLPRRQLLAQAVGDARVHLVALRTAWPWLAECRLPGNRRPTHAPRPSVEQRAAVADMHRRERDAAFAAIKAGRTLAASPAPAHVGVISQRARVLSDLVDLTGLLAETAWGHEMDYSTIRDPAQHHNSRAEPCQLCHGAGPCACDLTDMIAYTCIGAVRQLLDGLRVPEVAAEAAATLQRLDRTCRRAVGAGDDRVPLPGVRCPACAQRGDLAAEVSNPDPAQWTLVCACRCTGHGCGCRRGIRLPGRRHRWLPAECAHIGVDLPGLLGAPSRPGA